MNDLAQLGVACMFDAATKDVIESWIDAVAASEGEVDPAIFKIYSKDVRASRSKFDDYFRTLRPDFTIDSEEGIHACATVLRKQIERLSTPARSRRMTSAGLSAL